jgi:hypothetical protein
MPFWRKSSSPESKDKATKLVVDRPTLAMLAQIAEAHNVATGEKLSVAQANKKLVSSYFEAPLSGLGKQMTEIMQGHSEARAKIAKLEARQNHPLLELWDQLPPEAQKALIAKFAGGLIPGMGQGGNQDFFGT